MGSYLDKVIRAAAGDADEEGLPDEGYDGWDETDWDDVRAHLESESPWFRRILAGESPGDPSDDVSLTPRTAEASTVHQPTVPPGGPGLFHIKGRELPPYVQHLYKHLVGKYGKHRAYGVAIGIVKKWAAGINPGGKGKGHHVHKDVQAAAARNVADWEQSKAMARKHHGGGKERDHKAAASANAEMVLALASVADYWRETPAGRMEEVHGYVKNNSERVGIIGSASGGMAHRELQGLYRANPEHERQFRTHLRDARSHYAAGRHAEAISALQRAQEVARAHSFSFVNEALGRQIKQVEDARQAAAQKAAKAAAPPPRKHGLFGRLGHHPVTATALDRVWQASEELELAAPAANPFGKPYKESMLPPGPTTGLLQGSPYRTGVISNAPGTRPAMNAQLRHEPAQTVSPSPPLPPGVSLPNGKDLIKLASSIQDGEDPSMATGVRKLLHTAAGKVDAGDLDGALYALRGAQTGVHSAYRTAYGANVDNTLKSYGAGFAGAVPPAQQSSATAAMLKGRKVTEHYRQVHHQIATHIDAIRRSRFHGMYNHMPEARLAMPAHPLEMLAPGAVGLVDKGAPPATTGNIPARLLRRRHPGMVGPYRREEYGREELVGGYERLAHEIEDTAAGLEEHPEMAGHLMAAVTHLRGGDGRKALGHLLSARTAAAVQRHPAHDEIMEHVRELRPHIELAGQEVSSLGRVELAFGFVRAHERREHGKVEEVGSFERHPEALEWWHSRRNFTGAVHPGASELGQRRANYHPVYTHGGSAAPEYGNLIKQSDGKWHAIHADGTDTTPGGNRSKEFALRHLEAYHNAMAAQPISSPQRIAELEAEEKRLDPLAQLERQQRLKDMSDQELREEHERALDALESHFTGDEPGQEDEEHHDEVVSEMQRRGLWKSDEDVMNRLENAPHSLTDAELARAFRVGADRDDGSHRLAIAEEARRGKRGLLVGK